MANHHTFVYADGYAYAHLLVGGKSDAAGLGETRQVRLIKEASLQVTLVDAADDMWVRATSVINTPELRLDDFGAMGHYLVKFASRPSGMKNVHLLRGLQPRSQVWLTLMKGSEVVRELATVTSGESESELRLTYDCWNRGVITGALSLPRELSPEGRKVFIVRVPKDHLMFSSGSKNALHSVRSDAAGRFRFESLPIGDYDVHVADQPEPKAAPDLVSIARRVSITAESLRADVELTLITGGYLTGVLLDAEGKPCPGRILASSPSRQRETTASARGVFRVGPFHPESLVRLAARVDRGSWNVRSSLGQTLKAPQDDIKLAFIGAGKVEGRVTGLPSQGRVREIHLRLTHQDVGTISSMSGIVKEGGLFSMGRLAPGCYSLSASLGATRKSASVSFQIRSGEVTGDIELALPPR